MLSQDLEKYVVLQRARGLKFTTQPWALRSFVSVAEQHGDTHVRVDRVLAWAALTKTVAHARTRLAIVRRFALALQIEDPTHEVPPADAFGSWRFQRQMPHIYSLDEIAKLIAAAQRLGPPASIRSVTYATLIGLLASTGLRVSEALGLKLDDITEDGLVIRETKFRKSRLVPMHTSVKAALDAYLEKRLAQKTGEEDVFVIETGRAPAYSTFFGVFLSLSREVGLRNGQGGKGPRIHDLRHTFAVRSLEACGNKRSEVSRHMLALATYMGHTEPRNTYWYLQTTPALMRDIAEAGESLQQRGGV